MGNRIKTTINAEKFSLNDGVIPRYYKYAHYHHAPVQQGYTGDPAADVGGRCLEYYIRKQYIGWIYLRDMPITDMG